MQLVRSADGTEIALDRSGDGPPLILVGGALQDRSSMKRSQPSCSASPLEVRWRSRLAPARCPSGLSSPTSPPYTNGPSREFADLLDELVDGGRRAEAAAAFLRLRTAI
jgi:pimeloyl-ACP methyl ester carboxylesterase